MQDLASVFADTNVSVRTVLDAVGDVWFRCTDVAKAVGYENVPQAVQNLMTDRKELSEIEPPLSIGRVGFSGVFGNQWKQAKVINLEMLNDFLMDSGKPATKDATRWRPHIKPETLEFNWHELQGVRVTALGNQI